MSLNETPYSLRCRISFFGKRNAGKSSLVNAITGQKLSVVSDVAGTTTDPVNKSMELLPIGPVLITDTPGFDDVGVLGGLRTEKTREVLNKTDIAVLVVSAEEAFCDEHNEFISKLSEKSIPHIVVYTKCDLLDDIPKTQKNEVYVSSKTGFNIDNLKNLLGGLKPKENSLRFLGNFVKSGDVVIFVTPIDESAPKGRLILPQQQAIRDALDSKAISMVVQPSELEGALSCLNVKPKLIVTDSQVFGKVNAMLPDDIPLTSFSILSARVKGLLDASVEGALYLDKLKDGDKILISEGCTHHRQCNDIGTVKLPKLIKQYTQKSLEFEFTSGGTFPENLKDYSLVVHCGGCMLSEKEMVCRVNTAVNESVPITNYGIVLAKINNILKRSLEIFPDLSNKI